MLRKVERPAFLDSRSTDWDVGDRVAWGPIPPTVRHMELEPLVSAFSHFRRPSPAPSQVIHGDLSGNILFDGQTDPVILDFAVYWRPAAFAEALVVADALAFHEADASLAGQISLHPPSDPASTRWPCHSDALSEVAAACPSRSGR
ncbi:MAG: hypothetical protein ABI782_09965 [Anaerolineaceae bacterium]